MNVKFFHSIKAFRPPLILSTILALLFSFVSIFLVTTEYGKSIEVIYQYVIFACAAVFLFFAVISIIKFLKDAALKKKFINKMQKSSLFGRIYDDYSYRTTLFAYISMSVNMLFAISKGVAGFWFSSWWLISLAAYYLILCIIKFILLKSNRRLRYVADINLRKLKEWKAYRFCGRMLISMTFILQGVVILITAKNNTFTYEGNLIFAVAMYDFYCLTMAIIYTVKNRKKHTPIVVSIKSVSLATSLVSMLSLQTAMFASFGSNSEILQRWMNFITGSFVCVFMLLFGIYMAFHAAKEIKKLNRSITVKMQRCQYD